jgi:hypothetical protein
MGLVCWFGSKRGRVTRAKTGCVHVLHPTSSQFPCQKMIQKASSIAQEREEGVRLTIGKKRAQIKGQL